MKIDEWKDELDMKLDELIEKYESKLPPTFIVESLEKCKMVQYRRFVKDETNN